MERSTARVALGFVDRINRHDVGALAALMAQDHRFVDGLGQETPGRQEMEQGWRGYFAWFSDYTIRVDQTLSSGDVVALFGTAQGTYAPTGTPAPRPIGKFWRHGRRWYATSVSLNGASMPTTSPSGRLWE